MDVKTKTVPKITSVNALDGLMLHVKFDDGTEKNFDVAPYLETFPEFAVLTDRELFCKVHVDCAGFAIAWNDEIDLSRYDIYED